MDAIVEIRISVPQNARTAERFGTNRVASGVVIDKTGHILTIGFQTIEAETVKIVGKDHKTVNATVVVNKQDVHGMAHFYRKVWALGKAGVDVPLRILQGIQIRDIVVHSTARNQYRQPVRKEKQTGAELL